MSAQAESRIISHMNASHQLSLEDYLVVYGDIAAPINPKMVSIGLDSLEIAHGSEAITTTRVPIDPPMESLKDARTVLVAMAKQAASDRGFSHFRIDEFAWPHKTIDYAVWALFTALLVARIAPHTVVLLGPLTPSARYLNWSYNFLYIVMAIHVVEFSLLLAPRLKKYRVPFWTGAKWGFSNLIDGIATIWRFDEIVASKEH